MALVIRTLAVTEPEQIHLGAGNVMVVNRGDAGLLIATSLARLEDEATRDEIPPGHHVEMALDARRDQVWVVPMDGTIPVAIYEA